MLDAISIKIPLVFITENEKIHPQFHMAAQKTTNNQGNAKQKEKCWKYHNT
jgi:hypothetical protein